ncbi:hypothetical protein SNK05_010575 [Fusarium graminearum]
MICKLKVPTEDIVVLTPYRANIGALGRRFRKESVLKGVEFTSLNRFQGREAQIVVLALRVDVRNWSDVCRRRAQLKLTRKSHNLNLWQICSSSFTWVVLPLRSKPSKTIKAPLLPESS